MTIERLAPPNVGPLGPSCTRALAPSDEAMHTAPSDELYWTETVWFAALVPEHHLGCWVYLHTRPNLGIASAGVWIWDDTSLFPWDAPYTNFRWHLPMPKWVDGNATFGDDISVECLEPFKRHRVTHRGEDGIALDLHFAALLPATGVGVGDTLGHFDQALWATGSISVDGRSLAVDGPGMRDRSWSPRPDGRRNSRIFYTFAVSESCSFQVHAEQRSDDSDEPSAVVAGSLTMDGITAAIVSADRRVESRRDGPPLRLVVEMTDELGRTAVASGRTVSAVALTSWPPFMTWVSVVQWTLNGVEVWGEDDETWSLGALAARRRRLIARDAFVSGASPPVAVTPVVATLEWPPDAE